MKKFKYKLVAFLIILVGVISLSYPFVDRYYLQPSQWKKESLEEAKNQFPQFPDSILKKFVNCLYLDFKNRYGQIEHFPIRSKYTEIDKIETLQCVKDYLLTDSCEKTIATKIIDSMKLGINKLKIK